MKVSMGCAWTLSSSGHRSAMRRMRRWARRFASQAHSTIDTNKRKRMKCRVFMALEVFDELLQFGILQRELCDLGR